MTDSMLPIIRQLHDAADDRGRADILLRCPDNVVLKFSHVFRQACRDFPHAAKFVELRVALMCAARNGAGGLPGGPALALETLRAELAAFAAGAPDPEMAAAAALDWPPAEAAQPVPPGSAWQPEDQVGSAVGPPSIDI